MEEKTLPKLLVSKEEAEKKIQERIEKGQKIRNQSIDSEHELDTVGKEAINWSKFNTDLLIRLFDNLSLKDEYENLSYYRFSDDEIETRGVMGWGIPDFNDYVDLYKENMTNSIYSLEGIRDRLELFEEPDPPKRIFGDKIFIVHGHDEAAKHKIARFIADLDLTETILDEQPSKGQTMIDKFEEHADEAGFAIVLLTADDLGAPKDQAEKLQARARQNVILEFGYFLAELGRERVCVLYDEGVELPSDIRGLSYVPLDSADGWKLKLAKEMLQADYLVDMNKIL